MNVDNDRYKATFEHTFKEDGHSSDAKLFEVGKYMTPLLACMTTAGVALNQRYTDWGCVRSINPQSQKDFKKVGHSARHFRIHWEV